MQYDDSFAQQKTVERSANASPTPRAKFEQSVAERLRVRKTKAWSELRQELDKTCVIGGASFDMSGETRPAGARSARWKV